MERFTLAQAAEWTKGETAGDAVLTAVSTDSRRIPQEALFLPLAGERFDGHDFIGKALENGAAAVMSHRACEEYPVPALYVGNTSQALLDLVTHPDYQPMVVFPASYAGPDRQVLSAPPSGKPPLFIMLDGTWTEARKMFRKSPYLDALPIISVDLSRISAYHLREAHADGQYCTAEVAIALLDLAGDAPAAAALGEHFTRFRTRYLAGKTQHKGSITAGQVENV